MLNIALNNRIVAENNVYISTASLSGTIINEIRLDEINTNHALEHEKVFFTMIISKPKIIGTT